VVPGSLDEQPSNVTVAGLGDRSQGAAAARCLKRYTAREIYQLLQQAGLAAAPSSA
jgi:hypothetical protein